MAVRAVLLFGVLLLGARPGFGQSAPATIADAPPAPVAPEVVTRDAAGNVTIRATRLATPLVLDGRLDDAAYGTTKFVSDFIQQEPFEGQPATERTDVWVFFDDAHVYVSARNWESASGRRVTSDMQRDSRNLYNNDHFAVMFDTFFDRRNGYYFYANSQGGMHDGQIGNESPTTSWNGLWDVRAADFEGGWTIEFKFPFRSFRFREDGSVWGVNFRRVVRWKNETSYLTPVPQSFGRRGLQRVSSAGTLVGIEAPGDLRNLDIKPYLTGSVVTNRTAAPPVDGLRDAAAGFDVKWGLTQNVIADLTFNTDFAQVEDDEAQVNLTRFSVFFPEKREFFLEGQDFFTFSEGLFGGGGGGGSGGGQGFGPSNAPVLFYSRRIGIQDGLAVPIVGGGRLQARGRGVQVGALHIRTGELAAAAAEPTDYSVLRVSRNILRRSRLGLIATRKAVPNAGKAATNYAYGADATFNLTTDFTALAYWAQTRTEGREDHDTSYRARAEYNSDRVGLEGEHMLVGANFNPEVGFLRRTAFRRSNAEARFSPRPADWGPVRKVFAEGSIDYYTSPDGDLESRSVQGTFRLEFMNTDRISVEVTESAERLDEDLDVGVVVPPGRYDFRQARIQYELSPTRPVSGFAGVAHGGFYGGTITELSWRGRVEFSPRFYAEPSIVFNRVRTPFRNASANLFGTRATYTLSPRMFVSALVQYRSSSKSMTANARFRWEYRPGSELFLVYSDGRSTLDRGFPTTLDTRSIVVKVTRLLRW